MTEALGYPYMYWVGMNPPADATPSQVTEFDDFYTGTHLGEVLASNPGFKRASRYELIQQDPDGDFGPRWLAVYEMAGEAAARGYAARNDGPAAGRPTYTPGPELWTRNETSWRMIWRKVSEAGASDELPHGIFMVGMNLPADASPEGVAEFNDFYSNVHRAEVMAESGYDRGVRFELEREFRHPAPGAPRFLAVYTADEAATEATLAQRRAGVGPGPRSAGPPTWDARETAWRLGYRLVAMKEI